MATVTYESTTIRVENIYGVGRNYAEHVAELNNAIPTTPLIFLKPNSALAPTNVLRLPDYSKAVDYETELVVLIGQDANEETTVDNAIQCIQGIGVGLDLTARDIQSELKRQGHPWLAAKGFRHAACVSDFVALEKLPSLNDLHFSLRLNGQLCQQGHSQQMIFSMVQVIEHLAKRYGLVRGDLIFTGTPSGVGQLKSGDTLCLNLEDIIAAEFNIE